MGIWTVILLSVLPLAAIAAALFDLTLRQIPNWLTIAIAVLFVPVALAAGLPADEIGLGLALGSGILVFAFLLFTAGWLGGGDAKLLAAFGCWVGLGQILEFLFIVVMAGGVLALVVLGLRAVPALRKSPFADRLARFQERRTSVPYGIALATGVLAVYPQTPVWLALAGT